MKSPGRRSRGPTAVPIDALPEPILHAFARVEEAQRAGAEPLEPNDPTTRRYELPEEGIVYFTEATRPPDPLGVAMILFVLIGFTAVVLAIVFFVDGSSWFLPTAGVSVVTLLAAMRFGVADARRAAARRAGVEREGLYLLPDTLIVRRRRDALVFPRSAIVRFEKRRRIRKKGEGGAHDYLFFVDSEGTLRRYRLDRASPGFRARCQRWLRDGTTPS